MVLYYHMKIEKSNCMLYIHPLKKGTEEPILDELTMRILNGVRNKTGKGVLHEDGSFSHDVSTKGFHHCTGCGGNIHSASQDIVLPNGLITNTLAVHYVAKHRSELSSEDITKINTLTECPDDLAAPTEEEMGKGWMTDYYSTY